MVLLQTAGNTACCVRSAACPIRPLSFVTRCFSLPPTLRHGARRHTPYGIDCWACGAARESDERRARGRYAAVVAVKLPSSLGELKKLYRHVPSSLSLYLSRALLLSHSLSLGFSLLLAPLPFVDLVHGRAWADPLRCLVVSWSRCRPSPPPRASVKSPPRLSPRPLRSTRTTHTLAREINPSAPSSPLHDEGRLAASPVARARVRGVALVVVVAVVFFFKERHTAAASCHDAAAEHDAGQVLRCDVITTSRC
mgnify:CR=1 FL=1